MLEMNTQNPSKSNYDAILIRQLGEVMFGAEWIPALSGLIGVSDRSMRRFAAGSDPVPLGVWADLWNVADNRSEALKELAEEIHRHLPPRERVSPIPNTMPRAAMWGLHFALHTDRNRTVRCMIRREVLDDRVKRTPLQGVFDYFQIYAPDFYEIAERKLNAGQIDGDQIVIGEDDVRDLDLPDVRKPVYVDATTPTTLLYEGAVVNCPTLQEAIIAWQKLPVEFKARAAIRLADGRAFHGAQIGNFYCA
jgi:hypothetical protein